MVLNIKVINNLELVKSIDAFSFLQTGFFSSLLDRIDKNFQIVIEALALKRPQKLVIIIRKERSE